MSNLEEQSREILNAYPAFKLAILFGSQAADFADSESDIDLALLSDRPLESSLKLELMEAIGGKLGRPVDIVDLYHVAEPVLGQVFKTISSRIPFSGGWRPHAGSKKKAPAVQRPGPHGKDQISESLTRPSLTLQPSVALSRRYGVELWVSKNRALSSLHNRAVTSCCVTVAERD